MARTITSCYLHYYLHTSGAVAASEAILGVEPGARAGLGAAWDSTDPIALRRIG